MANSAVIFLLQEIVRTSIAKVLDNFFELENGVELLVENHQITKCDEIENSQKNNKPVTRGNLISDQSEFIYIFEYRISICWLVCLLRVSWP